MRLSNMLEDNFEGYLLLKLGDRNYGVSYMFPHPENVVDITMFQDHIDEEFINDISKTKDIDLIRKRFDEFESNSKAYWHQSELVKECIDEFLKFYAAEDLVYDTDSIEIKSINDIRNILQSNEEDLIFVRWFNC